MATTTWPNGLQQLLNSAGFQKKFGNTVLRTDMDVGPAKVRSRYTDGVDTYQCSINISYDDYATLETFFKTSLNNGALPFTFVDPFSGDEADFRFVDPPSIQPIGSGGIEFEVTMVWEKLP